MQCCGLIVEVEDREPVPVPLTSVSVETRILDLVAEVTLVQAYVNKEDKPIEAVYKFPIDEGAAVCSFIAVVDDRVIDGVVKRTDEAEKEYDDAMRMGQSAFLVEEKLPDVFKAKIGNLAPGSGAKIRLTYVTELKVEGEEIRFFLPTTIAPRYIREAETAPLARELASITYTTDILFRMEVKVRITMASAITDIRSPTHKVIVAPAQEPQKSCVRLAEESASMDRDLVLYIRTAEPHQPRLVYEKSGLGSAALMLSLVPSFKLSEQKTELIFLVDRSGSMQGAGIKQAGQALKLFLHSLPIDCHVNVVGFGSTHQSLYPVSRRYDDDVLAETKAHAEALEANLGGTEIYQPLEWIFKQPPIAGYLRQILLLTDGQVFNTAETIRLVRQNSSRARVFALGLGSSASHHLVEGIARAGNGTALFASLEERLETKVMRQLQDALQPAMTDVRVEWQGCLTEDPSAATAAVVVQTEKTLLGFGKPMVPTSKGNRTQPLRQAPSQCPPVFDGKHLVVYGLLESEAALPHSVKLSAESPVGPLTVEFPIDPSHFETGVIVHRLAAKKLIQELQDSDVLANKMSIIELGCRYGLTSSYTSFVAVDPERQASLKDSWMAMKTRDVPIALSSIQPYRDCGSKMSRSLSSMKKTLAMGKASSAAPKMRSNDAKYIESTAAPRGIYGASFNLSADMLLQSGDAESYAEPQRMCGKTVQNTHPELAVQMGLMVLQSTEKTEPSDDDKLLQLVGTQSFDGAFRSNETTARLLNVSPDDIRQAGQLGGYNDTVWSTLVALAYLSLALSQLKETWNLVAAKATKWLGGQTLDDTEKAHNDAQDFVKASLSK